MARVYNGKSFAMTRSLEKMIFKLCGIRGLHQMNAWQYAWSFLAFNTISIVFVYIFIQLQGFLPLNPQHFSSVTHDLALNTAISFATATDWQAYSGETTMSYFTQMVGLTTQNFLAPASGLAVLIAFIRGFKGSETPYIGNFWVDLVRGVLYILLPLSFVLALCLASHGVIQNFSPYQKIEMLQPTMYRNEKGDEITLKEQLLPMGPVASQVAIKQLGNNGGGFFNVNSAHPFENPTQLSNFLEMLAILLIPAGLCCTFGQLINDKRQGWALLFTMLIVYAPLTHLSISFERSQNPLWSKLGPGKVVDQSLGNMEGKETRFGAASSTIWATAATATSTGSVNSMLDSFSPLGGMASLTFMLLGEVIFGGVGCGLYGLLIFVIMTVFVSGLMVGRTPEYLGKKIESFEIKMASFAVIIMPLTVLICTAMALFLPSAKASISNPGPHGLTQVLYAFASMANNNGSGFAGLNANTTFYNLVGSLAMLLGRYGIAIPVLAIAGSMAKKKIIPSSLGTLPTHTPLFVILLISILLLVGALTFFPALALGPLVEHLMQARS